MMSSKVVHKGISAKAAGAHLGGTDIDPHYDSYDHALPDK